MIVGRVIGWVFLLAGAAVLARDVMVWLDTKVWAPIALGQLWYQLDRSSLNLAQAVIQRYVLAFLWDPIIVSILLAVYVNLHWLWLTGLLGAHLVQASFTGMCPVVMMLKRMGLPSKPGFT